MIKPTKIAGVPDRSSIVPGMAYFAGTGPIDKTCGHCKHRGYYRQSKSGTWNEQTKREEFRSYHHSGCAMFKALTGKHGPAIGDHHAACKYFDAKNADAR